MFHMQNLTTVGGIVLQLCIYYTVEQEAIFTHALWDFFSEKGLAEVRMQQRNFYCVCLDLNQEGRTYKTHTSQCSMLKEAEMMQNLQGVGYTGCILARLTVRGYIVQVYMQLIHCWSGSDSHICPSGLIYFFSK